MDGEGEGDGDDFWGNGDITRSPGPDRAVS